MTPSHSDMLKPSEIDYMNAKIDATMTSFKHNGKTILRYKPGTLIRNSDNEVYQVQPNGSWKKLRKG